MIQLLLEHICKIMNTVTIIGAGIAGIATYLKLKSLGISAKIIEAGKPLTERCSWGKDQLPTTNVQSDGINGFGGAGLFSDRKWSGFPAGTGLLKQNIYELRTSFKDVIGMLKTSLPSHSEQFDMLLKSTDEYLGDNTVSSEDIERKFANTSTGSIHVANIMKKYPSVTIKNFSDGAKILQYLNGLVDANDVTYGVRIDSIERLNDNSGYSLVGFDNTDRKHKYMTQKLVFANGRFGPKLLKNSPFSYGSYKRTELGFRIKINVGSPLEKGLRKIMTSDLLTNDPKIIINRKYVLFGKDVNVQFRTFCVCLPKTDGENGYMVKTCDGPSGMTTFSGSSSFDEFKTRSLICDNVIDGSNMGIMMRICDPETVAKLLHSQSQSQSKSQSKSISNDGVSITIDPSLEIDEVLRVMSKVYPANISNVLYNGINEIINYITGDYPCEPFNLYGPCVEGVGDYPDVDVRSYELRSDSNVYVVGDASGYARGLLQSMVMGDMCGKYITQNILNNKLFNGKVIERYQDMMLPHSSYGKIVVGDDIMSADEYVSGFDVTDTCVRKIVRGIESNIDQNMLKNVTTMANTIVPVRFEGNQSYGGVLYEIHHFFLDGKVYGVNGQLHYITKNTMIQYISLCNSINKYLAFIQNAANKIICQALPSELYGCWNNVKKSINECMKKSIENHKFKSCVLALRTRKNISCREDYTDIPVMQSAFKFKPVSADLYTTDNDNDLRTIERYVVAAFTSVLDEVIKTVIKNTGSDLLMCRTKIETQEPAIQPIKDEALYYECHVKVNMKNVDGSSIGYYTKKRLIHEIAGMFEGSGSRIDIFNVMAVSINLLKHPEKGQQFFITYRTDTKEEMEFIRRNFCKIVNKITQVSNFTDYRFKCYTDAEFVVYDNNRNLDLPWFPIKTGFLCNNYQQIISRLVTSNRHLLLLTSNKEKYDEYQYNPTVAKKNICIHRYNYDTGPSNNMDIACDVKRKAMVAYEHVKRPIIVEGSGLLIESTNFPGAMTHKVIDEFGLEGFCENFKGKKTTAITHLIQYDGKKFTLYESCVVGTVTDKPIGENGFGWDSLFVPDGSKKTFAQMSSEEKAENSMRCGVINKFFN